AGQLAGVVLLLTAAWGVACTAGCGAGSGPLPAHRAAPARTDAMSVDPPPGPADPLPMPDRDPALAVLAEVAPTHGSADAGTVDAHPGPLWININCRGGADATVAFAPLDTFTVHCDDPVYLGKNQINLIKDHRLSIAVTAPDSVEWDLRVQE